MQDSLNLFGDGDDVDVLTDVENTFGIAITDREAETTLTVGQLYDLIQMKCANAGQTRACLSQIAFYRLRRALISQHVQIEIRPGTPISVVRQIEGNSTGQKWKTLSHESNLTLPSLEAPNRNAGLHRFSPPQWTLAVFGGMFGLGGAMLGLSKETLGFIFVGILTLGVVVGIAIHQVFKDIPRRITTVGDLARESAGCSFSELSRTHPASSPADQWQALTAVLRSISGHQPEITRNTTFFRS
jgi:hypothetical protein